ncbi:hypothetical protein J2X46_001978 [Nocardioides sp. BE266]|uniref:hypothetical protein n=1 Tax=Nocardioides sp. BE266 TaxID=2817725 RepID=UPI002857F2CA|nr:hypothetical protein [Nocardioides sp. BE266]MDR7252993.1 hypothetical protein [Nocardioides sp. BE266]
MFVRTRTLAAALLTVSVTAALAAPPGNAVAVDARVTARSWSPLSPSTSPNFAQASTVRTADGLQHVVWIVDEVGGANYLHTTIDARGRQGAVTRVLPTAWQQLSTPVDLEVDAAGRLRVAFRGTPDGESANFFTYRGVYSAISADGGASWVLPREVLAVSDASGGGSTFVNLPDGSVLGGYGDSAGFHWHVGAIPEAAEPTTTNAEFTDQDAVAAQLLGNGSAVWVLYQSIRSNGLYARQVWPTLGAPVRAPGEYTIPGQPVAVVNRPRVGPVAAYMLNDQVVLWDVLANRTHRVPGMKGASVPELAVLPDGHLWVASAGPIGYDPRASRVAARGWDVDRTPSMLPDLFASFGVSVSASTALRGEVLLVANDDADPTRLLARSVAAQLYLKATPRRWAGGRAQTVSFKVTDVDGGVARAKVKVGSRRCTTNGSGRCSIRLPGMRPGRMTAKATKTGYDEAKVTLTVRR